MTRTTNVWKIISPNDQQNRTDAKSYRENYFKQCIPQKHENLSKMFLQIVWQDLLTWDMNIHSLERIGKMQHSQ
jgi:hypothetical protein